MPVAADRTAHLSSPACRRPHVVSSFPADHTDLVGRVVRVPERSLAPLAIRVRAEILPLDVRELTHVCGQAPRPGEQTVKLRLPRCGPTRVLPIRRRPVRPPVLPDEAS